MNEWMNEWIIQDKVILILWSIYLPTTAVSASNLVSVCGMWARTDYWMSPRGQRALKPKLLCEAITSISQKAKDYDKQSHKNASE